jgi:DNA-binding SARP family transcriptional activator/tetratricopeptide (TPR) repeat protein
MTAEFCLLGEIEFRVDGQTVPVGGARQQAVLAVLLVEANRTVPAETLLHRVWGADRLPERPANALQSQITLLRRTLGPVPDVTVTWQSAGYRLAVDTASVDLHRFRDLTRQARNADDATATALLDQALALWGGEPLPALDNPWFATLRASLERERDAARLDFTDRRLRGGEHAALLPELADQVGAHPWDERAVGQLMLALYRGGRPTDALRAYHDVRQRLADELGTDPSTALQELHQRILTADPTLALTSPTHPSPTTTSVATASAKPKPKTTAESVKTGVPRQLPAAPPVFVGRRAELDALTGQLDGGLTDSVESTRQRPAARSVVHAISGTGGVGKTWLALHWAHRNLDRFPDGQLYVNLRGFDPSGQPLSPNVALRGFLAALGVEAGAIPLDLDAQAGLYRGLLADRRMLIVADNATDAAQVAPLLPGSSPSVVVVTSRNRLAGLAAAHGAHLLDLDVMSEDEARDLQVRHLGSGRLDAEPNAVAELLALCAGLPLALSITAARAAHHADFPLADLADELRETSGRLDALDAGDLHVNLRAVLSWSHHALDARSATVFALLGLATGPDIDLSAAASLTALPVGTARAVLRTLENASLVQQPAPGRYRMHDLVRLYCAERAAVDLTADDRTAASRRLVDFYLHTLRGADRLLHPQRASTPLDPPAEGHCPHHHADARAALRWLDTEHLCLAAALRTAVAHGWHAAVWQLAWLTETFHYRHGHIHSRIVFWQAGRTAADHLDDPVLQSKAHRNLGRAYAAAGRHAEGLDHLRRSLTFAERSGSTATEAHAHHVLTLYWEAKQDSRQALAHATRAHELFGRCADHMWEGVALNAVGWHRAVLGEHEQARQVCDQALASARRFGFRDSEAVTLQSLGYIAHHTGRHTEALDFYHQALIVCRDIGNTSEEATVLTLLGRTHAACDQHEEARRHWLRALRIHREQNRVANIATVHRLLDSLADTASDDWTAPRPRGQVAQRPRG